MADDGPIMVLTKQQMIKQLIGSIEDVKKYNNETPNEQFYIYFDMDFKTEKLGETFVNSLVKNCQLIKGLENKVRIYEIRGIDTKKYSMFFLCISTQEEFNKFVAEKDKEIEELDDEEEEDPLKLD
jgi:hypothetical protein